MDEPRPSTPRRGPGIADWLLFIAATAVAISSCRAMRPWFQPEFDSPWKVVDDMKLRGPVSFPIHITFWVELASPFLLAWTLALIPIQWRRPWPRRARLLRQPGTVVGLATITAILVSLVCWAILYVPTFFGSSIFLNSMVSQFYPVPFRAYCFLLTAIGHAVLTSWIFLALSGRWRAESSWIDRSGRILGAVWIILLPVNHWSAFITL